VGDGGGERCGEGEAVSHMQLQQKLSAHKLYNIQKIKYIKLMFIKLSIQQKHWGGGEMENSFFPTHIQLTQNSVEWEGEGGGRVRGKRGCLSYTAAAKNSVHINFTTYRK
jgi:hypothetical protein